MKAGSRPASRRLHACAAGILAMLALAACTTPQPRTERPLALQSRQPAAVAIPGVVLHQPRPGLYTAGQPGAGEWTRLPGLGIGTVINLRPPEEMQGRDEAAEVRAAGLDYVNLPIAGVDALTPENARALVDAIAAAKGKVLVHCASGNRAGALLALAVHAQGLPAADALALGKAAGLTGLEPAVRGKLGLPAAACADASGGRC